MYVLSFYNFPFKSFSQCYWKELSYPGYSVYATGLEGSTGTPAPLWIKVSESIGKLGSTMWVWFSTQIIDTPVWNRKKPLSLAYVACGLYMNSCLSINEGYGIAIGCGGADDGRSGWCRSDVGRVVIVVHDADSSGLIVV